MTFRLTRQSRLFGLFGMAAIGAAAIPVSGSAQAEALNPQPLPPIADGWYLAAASTLSTLNDTAGTIANAPIPGSTVHTQSKIKDGAGALVAIGRSFGAYRLEGEWGYTVNKQTSYDAIVPPKGPIPANVKDVSTRLTVNLYRDFDLGRIKPFIGGGVGMTRVSIDFFAPRAPFPTEAPRQLIKDSDTRFAYQLMLGASAPVTRAAAITLQYRWFDAGTIHGKDARGEQFTRDHGGGSFDVGLRVRF